MTKFSAEIDRIINSATAESFNNSAMTPFYDRASRETVLAHAIMTHVVNTLIVPDHFDTPDAVNVQDYVSRIVWNAIDEIVNQLDAKSSS